MTEPVESRVTEGVDPIPVKRKRGRPLGSKTRKPVPPGERVRLRDIVARAYSEEELQRILRKLTPDQAARLLASIEPRAREDAPQSTFRLAIVGLREGDTCPRCGWQYGDALPDDPESPPHPVEGNGESVREAARRAQKPFPSEPPAVRSDESPPDPPGVRLLDPDGRPISFAPPDVPPVGPYGPHEIP